jgi:hypothetical protein
MLRSVLTLVAALGAAALAVAQQPTVTVEPSHLQGPRTLEDQTANAVVRDYLESWQTMRTALDENNPATLDRDFIGEAKDKLAQTVQQQAKFGIHTQYSDTAHDIQIVFYSPEGLSIELTDNVEYDVRILDRDKLQATQHVSARYIVVLTPSEVRWRVRVFQAVPR